MAKGPKQKTVKAAAKRFWQTGTGRWMRRQTRRRHLLEWKPSDVKRHLSRATPVHPTDVGRLEGMIPGGLQ